MVPAELEDVGNSQVLRPSFCYSMEAFHWGVGKREMRSQFSCHHWGPLLLSKREAEGSCCKAWSLR